jgi:hypothetical protein
MGLWLFFVGLSCLLTHELDAVQCREWRIFPGLSQLDDQRGFVIFTALHVPLFALLLWALFSTGFNHSVATGLNVFMLVHVGLHLLFLRHPHNEFTTPRSWALISGTGLCGALSLGIGW